MIIAFTLQGENENFPVIPRTEMMIASLKKFMTDAKIIQLSNMDFEEAEGIDECIRTPLTGDFIDWSFDSFISVLSRGENVLAIGTDVLLKDDVSDVFNEDFDVAACKYPLRDRTDGVYCGDVNFFKPNGLKFIQDVAHYYRTTPQIRDGWEGGQTAFRDVLSKGEYNFLELDYEVYCNTPESTHEDVDKAKILHFRGRRKVFMPFYADKLKLVKPYDPTVVCNVPSHILTYNVKEALKLPLDVLAKQHHEQRTGPLFIIGGGPSLSNDLERIKAAQGSCVIWALNNTFRYLCENGIQPDAHIMLDAREENIHFVPEKTDALLLYCAQCHPKVFEKGMAAGKVITWCSSIPDIVDILKEKEMLKEAAIVSGGSSVGMKAIGLAAVFGFSKIHLYGYDSSYSGDENHAYKQPLNDDDKIIEITVNDQQFKCAPWMATQASEFRETAQRFVTDGMEIEVHGYGLLPYIASLMVGNGT